MQFLQDAQYLASRLERGEVSPEAFASSFSRLMAAAIGARRTGVWVIGTPDDDPSLVCLGSHDTILGGAFHSTPWSAPDLMSRIDFLRALDRDGSICANDLRAHAATARLHAAFLSARGVESILAVAFSVNGELRGAFTCASIGHRTDWTAHQLATLKRLVVRVSPALARSENRLHDGEGDGNRSQRFGASAGLVQDRGLAG